MTIPCSEQREPIKLSKEGQYIHLKKEVFGKNI